MHRHIQGVFRVGSNKYVHGIKTPSAVADGKASPLHLEEIGYRRNSRLEVIVESSSVQHLIDSLMARYGDAVKSTEGNGVEENGTAANSHLQSKCWGMMESVLNAVVIKQTATR